MINAIEERKAYLLKKNEVAKQLLLNNLSDLDLSSYILPDIKSKVDDMSNSIFSTIGNISKVSTDHNIGIFALILEWVLKIKSILED